MRHNTTLGILGLAMCVCAAMLWPHAATPAAARTDEAAAEAGLLRVAMLRYGAERKSSICFSSNFLTVLEYESGIRASRRFVDVDLASDDLFQFPFAIMTGEGTFTLSDDEILRLNDYVTGGGFLLVSAGCSNGDWNESMSAALGRAFPDAALKDLSLEHDVFHTVFDITGFESKKRGGPVRIRGIEVDGRLSLIYSPHGLNDTKNAPTDCCCCGANEILNAKYINANIVAYALTH
ncbi:MAG: DUF4159 domain-containing protein [Planctomycetota bacterium]